MKKYTSILIAACLLCCACKANNIPDEDVTSSDNTTIENTSPASEGVEESADTSAETTTTTETIQNEVSADNTDTETTEDEYKLFLTGVYCSYIADTPTGFYIMDEAQPTGTRLDFENGSSTSFEYEIGINEIMFYFDTSDGELYTVTGGDLSCTQLELPDGTAMSLIYDDSLTISATEFYSNDELCVMALDLYSAQTGYTPSCAAAISNSDGTVTIQLYDNLDDHNSTSAWYTIDRFTGEGTDDITGEYVSLVQ